MKDIRVHCHDGSVWMDTATFDNLLHTVGGNFDPETDCGYLDSPVNAVFLYI